MKYYEYLIDDELNKSLFMNDKEFEDFALEIIIKDGLSFQLLSCSEELSIEEILHLPLEWSYIVECLAIECLDNAFKYTKWYEQERALKELGIIP